jgi:hypothetical protein
VDGENPDFVKQAEQCTIGTGIFAPGPATNRDKTRVMPRKSRAPIAIHQSRN